MAKPDEAMQVMSQLLQAAEESGVSPLKLSEALETMAGNAGVSTALGLSMPVNAEDCPETAARAIDQELRTAQVTMFVLACDLLTGAADPELPPIQAAAMAVRAYALAPVPTVGKATIARFLKLLPTVRPDGENPQAAPAPGLEERGTWLTHVALARVLHGQFPVAWTIEYSAQLRAALAEHEAVWLAAEAATVAENEAASGAAMAPGVTSGVSVMRGVSVGMAVSCSRPWQALPSAHSTLPPRPSGRRWTLVGKCCGSAVVRACLGDTRPLI